jgi:hypothetical protein
VDNLTKLIIGKAMETLVRAGADASVVGEFAVKYPQQILELMDKKDRPTDLSLEDVIQATVLRTKEVLGQADGQAAELPLRRARGDFARVTVEIASKRTTITIARDMFEQVAAVPGSKRAAINVVRRLAIDVMPGAENFSQAVRERIKT